MYELIILSRLMRHPAHGYLIAKIINDIIGPFAKISSGRFYPLLAKLEQGNYIEIYNADGKGHPGERQTRQYAITPKGRVQFHRLMMDTTANPGEYSKIFLHKAAAFDLVEPEKRRFLIEHYINYSQAHILHLKAEGQDLIEMGNTYPMRQVELTAVLDSIEHLSRQWELELAWAKQLLNTEKVAELG